MPGDKGVHSYAVSPEALDELKAALPGVDLPMTEFAVWVVGTDARDGERLREAYLVWACAQGAPLAHQRLDREFLSKLGPAIGRIDRAAAFHDEVLQRVRARLLVSDTGEPRILSWSGAAPLLAWLSAVAVRTALNLTREQGRAALEDDDSVLDSVANLGPAPELALARAQHTAAFRTSFREAFATLSARERNLLRLQVVEGLTLADIGALYQVNKSTVSRWLGACHQRLGIALRARLSTALDLDACQLDSVINGLQSNLELSLSSANG
jgi:RNA polymerase sigma-70 factor